MQSELARLMAENADLKTGVWKPAGGKETVEPASLEDRCVLPRCPQACKTMRLHTRGIS